MTSEVLMLNKDAVVIAADSAVTTGRDPHPRYSKAANKIFDVSIHGNVAVTLFASAEIDRVPWELTLKQFRHQDATIPQRQKLEDYASALIGFLERHPTLFPDAHRKKLLEARFFQAAGFVLREIAARFPDFSDLNKADSERIAAWKEGYNFVQDDLRERTYQAPLTDIDYQQIAGEVKLLEPELAKLLNDEPTWNCADAVPLLDLSVQALVKRPTEILAYTGLVIAGYGADEIFPSFVHVEVYGHVGAKFVWKEANRYIVTHDSDAWIQPFAQSSMIERFTDGFDSKLTDILFSAGQNALNGVITDLDAAGHKLPEADTGPILQKRLQEFMQNWRKKNWEVNFHPLRRVLNNLSVSEMGHLAESLLVLEELRERVTSPSESVGGPIDVVVITKAEGLIWLKRKHYFDPDLNPRYALRAKANYNGSA